MKKNATNHKSPDLKAFSKPQEPKGYDPNKKKDRTLGRNSSNVKKKGPENKPKGGAKL